jgi:hypothetical protein
MQIEAAKMDLEASIGDVWIKIARLKLGKLYVDKGMYEEAYTMLESIIRDTDNTNIIRDCVEQLCRIVLNGRQSSNPFVIRSYKAIKTARKKYGPFSPLVNDLIREVDTVW